MRVAVAIATPEIDFGLYAFDAQTAQFPVVDIWLGHRSDTIGEESSRITGRFSNTLGRW